MPLEVGSKLGPYELEDAIGAGGMGEVYRAKDPRLGRHVAIKILPESFSSDAQRLRRFEQEARSAAALSHPNILAVHDVGTSNGAPYIVSELLEGETLRDRLKLGPVPLRKAVEWAIQVAHGLSAAHDKGIIHRDLKPENIFITRDGRVKILDFGVAKLTRPDIVDSGDPTRTLDSDVNTVIGTVGYMAPEQLRGKVPDLRADLFSFGAILYEMLSGERAFKGDSTADTITAILTRDPPEPSRTNSHVPPSLDRIVHHCLEKSREERFQSAHDIAFDLEMLTTTTTGTRPPVVATPRRLLRVAGVLVVALLLLALGILLGKKMSPEPTVPSYQQITFRRGTIHTAKFAPDGQVVYSAAWEGNRPELFTTSLTARGSASTGIKKADIESISRSGELLLVMNRQPVYAFVRPGTLAVSPLSGSAPRPVLESVQDADWAPNGTDFAVARYVDGRFRLEFPIGKLLYETTGWISFPRVSPKGDMVAFLDHAIFGDDRGRVAVVDRSGKMRHISPEYASTQALGWSAHTDELWFSAAVSGSAADLYAADLSGNVRTITRVPGGLRLLDIARDGRVIMAQGHVRRAAMVLGPGQKSERDLAVADWSINRDISDDGSTVLIEEEAEGAENGQYSVYLRKTDGSQPVRLGEGQAVRLSPDLRWVLSETLSNPSQIFLLPTGPGEQRVLSNDLIDHFDAAWLPDSTQFVFSGREAGHKPRVYLQDTSGAPPRPLTPEGMSGYLQCSPDGKTITVKDEQQTWLVPLDGSPPRTAPGLAASDFVVRWSADGRALYVTHLLDLPGQLFRVDLATGKRQLVKEFAPVDSAGVEGVGPIQITPDLKYQAYGFARYLTDMYAVDGLR